MSRRTATIRVLCRADRLDETARLLAWAVGHPVEPVEAPAAEGARWLRVLTELAYDGDNETILERLGLDLIGKIAGVQYWEVVPSDAPAAGTLPAAAAGQGDGRGPGLEERLTGLLGTLPAPIALMHRGGGRYVWKWMNATGEAGSFVAAVGAALKHAVAAYVAVQAELGGGVETEATNGRRDQELEIALARALSTLPIPVAIEVAGRDAYVWRWSDATGEADTFVAAVAAALTHVTETYLAARRRLLDSGGEPLSVPNPAPPDR